MELTDRFSRALQYACMLHARQKRKGTDIPYIAHVLAVTSIVLENGGGEDEAVAALLHDAIEDQGGDTVRKEILQRFGDRVAAIVEGCTDSDTIPKPPWRQRKEAYIKHIGTAPYSVRLVSAADKLHNARAILNDYITHGEDVWNRFNGGKKGTLWYYRTLVNAYKTSAGLPFLQELERVVQELERRAGAAT